MSIESLFHDLLGLGTDWHVKELAHLPGAHSEVRIVIEATAVLYERYKCPDDGGSVRHYDDAPVRMWRHLNIFQHECYLECRLPRVKCDQCGKVRTVQGPCRVRSRASLYCAKPWLKAATAAYTRTSLAPCTLTRTPCASSVHL